MPAPYAIPERLELIPLPGVPHIHCGANLEDIIQRALQRCDLKLQAGDVLCITSKVVSRAEGREYRLSQVRPSPAAHALATACAKDARLVELVLQESSSVSRVRPGALIVRHRLGFVCANAGIDASNVGPGRLEEDDRVLLLPRDPDRSAKRLCDALATTLDGPLGILITDSHGRAFRRGTVGVTIGCAGFSPLQDHRGRPDLHGRPLQHSTSATADQLAAAADLVAGQADEGRPFVLIRGVRLAKASDGLGASSLYRDPEGDLFA